MTGHSAESDVPKPCACVCHEKYVSPCSACLAHAQHASTCPHGRYERQVCSRCPGAIADVDPYADADKDPDLPTLLAEARRVSVLDQWDYAAHPGDCCPRAEGGVWTVCCRECAGTGVFPVPWINHPSEGSEDATCVKCKATGRAGVCILPPGSGRES